jgi:hypothetical protein
VVNQLGRHLDINYGKHHDAYMRTTLTLDEDVASYLKEQTKHLGIPFKQVVNDTIRDGIRARAELVPPKKKFVVKPHSGGLRPGYDWLKLNQLAEPIEAVETPTIPRNTYKNQGTVDRPLLGKATVPNAQPLHFQSTKFHMF